MNFCINVINNEQQPNGSDCRYHIWKGVLKLLKSYGHQIYMSRIKKCSDFRPFATEFNFDKHKDLIDFYIGCCVYNKKKHEFDYFSPKIPYVIYEAGWLYNSIVVDRKKLCGDSYYYSTISQLIQENFNHDDAETYRQELLQKGLSKWLQKKSAPIPDIKYIFLPGQVLYDISISAYCSIGLLDFIERVVNFARKHQLHVIYKPHPGLLDIPQHGKQELYDFTYNLTKKTNNFHIVNTSIFDLMKRAEFTACLNAGTVIDNIITGTMVYSCGQSFFTNSGVVVYSPNVEEGLTTMLNGDFDSQQIQSQQLKMLWWLKNNLMQEHLSPKENLARLEYHSGVSFEKSIS